MEIDPDEDDPDLSSVMDGGASWSPAIKDEFLCLDIVRLYFIQILETGQSSAGIGSASLLTSGGANLKNLSI